MERHVLSNPVSQNGHSESAFFWTPCITNFINHEYLSQGSSFSGSSFKCCHGYFYLDVDRPIVGRDEEGLERSLVDAARRREELGRDVGLVGI